MRPEKKFLVEEVRGHLDKSDYLFVTDYARITVDETAELREELHKHEAEFHVVKNSALNVASKLAEYPDLSEWLSGPTAIVTGGNNAPGVAKALQKFYKSKDKVSVKVGVLDKGLIESKQVGELASLPSKEALQAQLLGLLNTPAQQLVRVLQGVPQGLLNVLKAQSEKGGE